MENNGWRVWGKTNDQEMEWRKKDEKKKEKKKEKSKWERETESQ